MIDDGGMQIASKENTFGEAAPSLHWEGCFKNGRTHNIVPAL
jgi:hypothetical protein